MRSTKHSIDGTGSASHKVTPSAALSPTFLALAEEWLRMSRPAESLDDFDAENTPGPPEER